MQQYSNTNRRKNISALHAAIPIQIWSIDNDLQLFLTTSYDTTLFRQSLILIVTIY